MSDSEHSESEFYYPDEDKDKEEVQEGSTNSQQEIENFIQAQQSVNTVKKTASDLKTFYRYLEKINKKELRLEFLPREELNHLLCKFFMDVRKVNGDEYEPGSLSGLQRSIQRYLTSMNSPVNILQDREFEKSRQVLASKRKNLVHKAGKGNKPNATRALTNEEEDTLFQAGEFGSSGPEVLQRTIWWFLALHFGFRARDESRKLRWGDVELQKDQTDGREILVWLSERGSKTPKGQERGHQRSFLPKVYATDSERCPVKYYKIFKSHRPVGMNAPDAPFFLSVRNGRRLQNGDIWYTKSPLGKNEIGKFLTKAAQNAGLQRSGSKISNHSVRKTCISRLLDGNTPENFVAQLSGHKSTESLQSYKSASDQHQRQMSYLLSRKQPTCTTNISTSNSETDLITDKSSSTFYYG